MDPIRIDESVPLVDLRTDLPAVLVRWQSALTARLQSDGRNSSGRCPDDGNYY